MKKIIGLLLAFAMTFAIACPIFAAAGLTVKTDKAEYAYGDKVTITVNQNVKIRVIAPGSTEPVVMTVGAVTVPGEIGYKYDFNIPKTGVVNGIKWPEGEYKVVVGNDIEAEQKTTTFTVSNLKLENIAEVKFLTSSAIQGSRKDVIGIRAISGKTEFKDLVDVKATVVVKKNGSEVPSNKYTMTFDGKNYSDGVITSTGKKFNEKNISMNFSNVTGSLTMEVVVEYGTQKIEKTGNISVSAESDNPGVTTGGGGGGGTIITSPSSSIVVTFNNNAMSENGIIGGVSAVSQKVTPDSFTVNISVGGVAKTSFVGYDPILVKVPYTSSSTNLVVVDGSGNAVTRSYYSNGNMYVALNNTAGTFTIKEMNNTFGDVNHPWAEQAISALSVRNIINGVGDNLYDPDRTVTRAEFIKLIVAMFNVQGSYAQAEFTDVDANAWYASYISTAKALNITTGYEDGTFRPDAKVSREEMSTMLYRAAQALSVKLNSTNSQIIFDDNDTIQGYARQAVSDMQKAGILKGVGENKFAPTESCTRAQAAVAINNMFAASMVK